MSIFTNYFCMVSWKLIAIFFHVLKKPKLCLPLKKLKNVLVMCMCGSDWMRKSACLKKTKNKKKSSPHVFLKVDSHFGRKESKTERVTSVLALCHAWQTERYSTLLCLHSQTRVTHWILFSLYSLVILFFFFLFVPPPPPDIYFKHIHTSRSALPYRVCL